MGQADIALNDTGIQQAGRVASFLACNIEASALYSSNLKRASETAAIISKATGLEPVFDARLREVDAGTWSGHSMAAVKDDDETARRWLLWRNGAEITEHGGETYMQLQNRALESIDDIIKKHPGRSVIVVTHGGVIRVILSFILKCSISTIEEEKKIPPASVTAIKWTGADGFKVLETGVLPENTRDHAGNL